MNNSEKVLKLLSNLIETGILKFKRDNLIDKLKLVSREEFNILKKVIEKQQKQINELKKKTTKAKKF